MHSISTRTRLIVSIGLILLLGFLATNLANYYMSRKSVREKLIRNELPLTSNNIYSEIQAGLLRPIYISSLMANDTFLKDWMIDGEKDVAKVTKYLREIRDRYDVFSTFVVSSITGRYYYFDGILKTVSRNSKKDSWFFSMEDHPADYRVDVDTNEAAKNELTIFINHKLFDYQGRFMGVTGIGLNAVGVSKLIQKYKATYKRNIYFVDRSGMIKSHENNRIIDKLNIRDKPGIAAVADTLLAGKEGILEYRLGGDNILLTYRFIPELDWFLIVEQPESEALAGIRQTFLVNTAIGLLITLAVLLISGFTVDRFQRRLESMAKLDRLTGLYNRQYFDAICESAIRRLARIPRPLSVIVFDIDAFKTINDRYGHLAGDQVFKDVAACARRVVRDSDVVARWGGDEFIVLLNECDEARAYGVAEKLRKEVAAAVRTPGGDEQVTISAGVAQHRRGDTYERLLERADDCLYRAKQGGRNQTQRPADDGRGSGAGEGADVRVLAR
jgi:diguanylate cyclase (GGDEF)-like protein